MARRSAPQRLFCPLLVIAASAAALSACAIPVSLRSDEGVLAGKRAHLDGRLVHVVVKDGRADRSGIGESRNV